MNGIHSPLLDANGNELVVDQQYACSAWKGNTVTFIGRASDINADGLGIRRASVTATWASADNFNVCPSSLTPKG